VTGSLSPGQTFIGILHNELVAVLGERSAGLSLQAQPPVVVLLAGLQGAGKTTTALLARWLFESQRGAFAGFTDVRRPAAILQLQRLAEQVVPRFPVESARSGGHRAYRPEQGPSRMFDVLIVDTAGRLHVDAELMEVRQIDAVSPHQRLSSWMPCPGRILNSARPSARPELSGLIVTKADGDARGGAALSVHESLDHPVPGRRRKDRCAGTV
jgi:signal recognition particle subunit SRP54